MKTRLTALCWMLALLTITASAPAQQTASPVYLPAGSVDIEKLIGPPPAADSPAMQTQLAIVLWLQKTRTPEQVAFVRTKLDLERFAPLLGDGLLSVDGIDLKQTIDEAIVQVRADYDAVKDKFGVSRPFQTYEEVEPVMRARPVGSYPSGHAIRAIVYARLLSEFFPERRDALMELARQVGYGRVIAGVHYPMDIVAGQKAGHAYADAIIEQASFKEAVERIGGVQAPAIGD